MEDVMKIGLKTTVPSYKVCYVWEFESYSKLPEIWEKKSQDFSVEPESNWYVKFSKYIDTFGLYLRRSKGKSITARYEASILTCENEVIYTTNQNYADFKEVDLWPSKRNSDLINFPEDKVTFKVSIILTEGVPSTVYTNPPQSITETIRLKTLSNDLKKLLDSKVKADVTFNIGGETLSAHKIILMARSEVFAKMFQEGMAEEKNNVVNIEDIDLLTMKILLSFLYSSEMEECDLDTALEVYRAADKYAVPDLSDACAHQLISKMTMESACKVLLLADMHHDQELKQKAMQFIALHYKPK